MQLQEVVRALEKAGTAQNRKVYANHGVGPEVYGVSYAVLRALAKKIGADLDLARGLWRTGNHDARILATLVVPADAMTAADADRWIRDSDNYVIANAVADTVAKTPHAAAKAEAWKNAGNEFVESAGWRLVGLRAMTDAGMTDAELRPLLRTIEREIHGRMNRVRHAMNSALVAIAGRSAALRAEALAAAERIGEVEVDHGETGCKTLDARAYILKVAEYKKQRAAGANVSKAVRSAKRSATNTVRSAKRSATSTVPRARKKSVASKRARPRSR
jgi:3-methyladenine DNA glycosylase AlkD